MSKKTGPDSIDWMERCYNAIQKLETKEEIDARIEQMFDDARRQYGSRDPEKLKEYAQHVIDKLERFEGDTFNEMVSKMSEVGSTRTIKALISLEMVQSAMIHHLGRNALVLVDVGAQCTKPVYDMKEAASELIEQTSDLNDRIRQLTELLEKASEFKLILEQIREMANDETFCKIVNIMKKDRDGS